MATSLKKNRIQISTLLQQLCETIQIRWIDWLFFMIIKEDEQAVDVDVGVVVEQDEDDDAITSIVYYYVRIATLVVLYGVHLICHGKEFEDCWWWYTQANFGQACFFTM